MARIYCYWHQFISDFRLLQKNGKVKWLSSKAVSLIDVDKVVSGYIGMLSDITEHKYAEEELIKSKKYFDNIINSIGDPVFVKDDQSRLLIVNDAFCSLFNLSRVDILGKTLVENVSVEERESFLRIDKHVISSGIENVNEETLTLSENKKKIVSTKKTRFVDSNENKFLIGVIRNITEKKKAEVELEKHRNNLEELVDVRTSEL
ncbi:PAS domain-containing protein [Maribacter forsetii]|uniref:PAS domain-containing protein n=1 Tax=Maribacter forsetii TaxID=444515 RepID=UPI00068E2D40|nr:PAS domain-containing protein [Maribacter forsetii]